MENIITEHKKSRQQRKVGLMSSRKLEVATQTEILIVEFLVP